MSERMTAEELARDRATVLLRDGRKVEVRAGRGDAVNVMGPDDQPGPLPEGGFACRKSWTVPLADIEKVLYREFSIRIWFGPGTPALKPMAPLYEGGATLMAHVRIPEDVGELREAYVRLVARAEIAQKAGPGQLVKAVGEVGRGGDQKWEWRPYGCGKFYRGDLPAGSPVHGGDGRLIEPGERVRLSDGREGVVTGVHDAGATLHYAVKADTPDILVATGPDRTTHAGEHALVAPNELVPLVNP